MIFKCKICGGNLEIQGNNKIITCEYCGTKQTLPKLENDKIANLYDRANHFRRNNEYDKAEAIYEMILNEDVKKYPLLNEIFAIRDNRHNVNNYTICVNGYISLDVINKAIKLQKENEELKILKDDIQDKRIIYIDTPEFEENYISVQKIKGKIEELNNESNAENLEYILFKKNYTIAELVQYVLQELIEREEEQDGK